MNSSRHSRKVEKYVLCGMGVSSRSRTHCGVIGMKPANPGASTTRVLLRHLGPAGLPACPPGESEPLRWTGSRFGEGVHAHHARCPAAPDGSVAVKPYGRPALGGRETYVSPPFRTSHGSPPSSPTRPPDPPHPGPHTAGPW